MRRSKLISYQIFLLSGYDQHDHSCPCPYIPWKDVITAVYELERQYVVIAIGSATVGRILN